MMAAKREKAFTILGACKVSIGHILDALHSVYSSKYIIKVQIVHNIPPEQNQFEKTTFAHPEIQIEETDHTRWSPTGNENLILSGVAPSTKRKIYSFFLKKFGIDHTLYMPVIHAKAYMSQGTTLEGPALICAGTVIEQYCHLEKFVSIFTNSTVGHHTQIGEFTTILMGNNVAGFCKVGKHVILGMGSNIFNRLSIGDHTLIGGGSVVTRSIEEGKVAYGSPAKIIRSRNPSDIG